MTALWQYSALYEDTNTYMLENEVLCDVTFLVGEAKEEMKCHKYMLVSRSPVFYTMFCGSVPETTGPVVIPDIDTDVWKSLIRFIYTTKCDLDVKTVMKVMYAARKYDVPALVEKCSEFLTNNTTVENVCSILDQAILFEQKDLIQTCLELISRHASEVFTSDEFVDLSRDGLKAVLELDKLDISGEAEVYVACKRWAGASRKRSGQEVLSAKDLKSELVDCLPLIRFAAMTVEDFCSVVAIENILSDTEKICIVRDIVNKENLSHYSNKIRGRKSITFDVVRFGKIQTSWSHNGHLDGISFTVSCPCSLTAVAMYLPHVEGQARGPLEIFEEEKEVLSQTTVLEYDQNRHFQFIKLKTEIKLTSGIVYSVRQRLLGQNTFKGIQYVGKQRIENIEVEFTTLIAGTSSNGTSLDNGQIHGIRLKK